MKTNDDVLKRNARVDVADVLRGLAVMGIILLHSIEHFNFYSFPDTSQQSVWLNFTDRAIWDGLFFMFGGKGYAIFSILFGFSFFTFSFFAFAFGFSIFFALSKEKFTFLNSIFRHNDPLVAVRA